MKQYLTTKEVCGMTQSSKKTVLEKYIAMGLAYIPISKRKFLFNKEDVENFLENMKEQNKIIYRR